jgi:hypothetical protein
MKKLGVLLCLMFVILFVGGSSLAQTAGDNSVYFVTYYSNANTNGAADAVLRVVNDGDAATTQSEGVPNGGLWASIYVFDDSQELQECCSCPISSDGMLSESVNKQLTANELTGRQERTRGVIKVISSASSDPTAVVLKPGLRGWMTHIQATSNIPEAGPFSVTETRLADSNLSAAELAALESSCSFAITLGSGYGVCSCTLEDHDF